VCTAFDAPKGFPMKGARIVQQVPLEQGACVFEVPPGTWAVAVAHDQNADGQLTTNRFGMPLEGWASSQNVKPALRAPSFEESKLQVGLSGARIQVTMRY
jgi:uncharacterized protein (DUF2141 family)